MPARHCANAKYWRLDLRQSWRTISVNHVFLDDFVAKVTNTRFVNAQSLDTVTLMIIMSIAHLHRVVFIAQLIKFFLLIVNKNMV
jgi:hypothetical protein